MADDLRRRIENNRRRNEFIEQRQQQNHERIRLEFERRERILEAVRPVNVHAVRVAQIARDFPLRQEIIDHLAEIDELNNEVAIEDAVDADQVILDRQNSRLN